MDEPRICIVGAGNLSTNRIYPYIGAAGGVLAGVCDLDREKAQRNARRFGGTAYSDMEEMIDKEHPDGIMICVGPGAHAALAPQALRKGVPVYTEKPPARNAAEALAVARVAAETGVLCMTAFKKRYAACYSRAREWIDAYPCGDLYSISIDYCSAQYPNDDRRQFLLDFGIHHIDLIGYLAGDPVEVFAFAKGLDAYAVSIRFANEAVGSMNLNDGRSWNLPTEEMEITIRGGNAMTIHNTSSWRICENGKATEWREPPTFISRGEGGYETGHRAEIDEFFAAITEKRTTTRSQVYESYKSMVLYEAIRESAETGGVVRPTYETVD